MTDSKQKILLFSSAVTLFTLVLGGYPPVINLIGITLFTLVLNDLCLKRLTPKSLIQKYTPHVLAIIISLIIFLFILHLLKTYGLQKETYNTAGIMLSEVFQKLLFCCSTAIKQFFVTHNFITYGYKYIGLCLFLLSLCRLFAQMPKTASYLITFALSIVGLLGATTATLFIAENVPQVLYAPRIDFFSLIYVYTFSAGVLLKSSTPFIRNLTFITLAALFFYNIKTTAEAEKSWQAGFIAETSFAERFLSRLEENPHFSANKGYTFVQGGTFDLRSRYYTAAKTNFTDSYTLSAPYIPWHLPSKAYRFYYPNNFFIEDFDIYWSYVNHKKLNLNDKLINYLSKDAMAWPSKDAVYMDEYTIILTLTPTGKELAREWINNLF